MDDRDELAAWLRLIETPGVGREAARRLLAAFGSPQAVMAASVAARRQVVKADAATALADPPPSFDTTLRTCEAWLAAPSQPPRAFVALGDPRYPALLLEAGTRRSRSTSKAASSCWPRCHSRSSAAATRHRRVSRTHAASAPN